MKRELAMVGGDNGKITAARSLTESEYEEYRNNFKILIDFSNKQQLFNIANLNFEEFKIVLNKYFIKFKNNHAVNWTLMDEMVMNINRLLLNFLSSFRTFLDHMEYILKKNYGIKSEEVKNFKNICSDQYDKYFSYRFLYKLRIILNIVVCL